MKIDNKKYLLAALGTVVVIALVLFLPRALHREEEQNQDGAPLTGGPLPSSEAEKELSGILKQTDDIERGNLMLVMPERALYINTVRDFNALVEKEVIVKIEGTEENFRLITIDPAPR